MTPDEIALNWYCTHCPFEFSQDWEFEVTLGAVIAAGLVKHQAEYPDCQGELHFESQFIQVPNPEAKR